MVYAGGNQACLSSHAYCASARCGRRGRKFRIVVLDVVENCEKVPLDSKIGNHADSKPYSFKPADKAESEKGHKDVESDE